MQPGQAGIDPPVRSIEENVVKFFTRLFCSGIVLLGLTPTARTRTRAAAATR